ncbi:amino acid aminotransferase [Halioxenophilus aromaticivorans]|uniref:Aminotransferase n=1 Tax=Halioxenophilus aromaticivorans TaxID=1306992 RepID=A0AAV3UA20_9ALTE
MFESMPSLPADPILGLTVACRADTNPNKVDLGVGVYKNEAGVTPVLKAVKQAEAQYDASEASKAYLPAQGTEGFLAQVNDLVFGEGHSAVAAGRVATIQGTGGCGSLRVAAELIKRANSHAKIWISDPSWPNHASLLGSSGLDLAFYPYYDRDQQAIAFDQMMAALANTGPGDVVLVHACCHNPSGADLTTEQWQQLTDLALARGFTPFIDMAYQGFGDGLAIDAQGIRYMADKLPEVVVANSFSKNFGLYRERVGTISIVAQTASQADVVKGQMLNVARAIYSMPPSHGAAIVETILSNPELKSMWLSELDEMRDRILHLRQSLVKAIANTGCERDFSFIERQKGMFSFVGITPSQVEELKTAYSIYMVDSSRINICGLSSSNVAYVADAIASVVSKN